MKLLTKTTWIQLTGFLVAFGIAGLLVFTFLDGMFSDEVEEQLLMQQAVISEFVAAADSADQLQIPSLRISAVGPQEKFAPGEPFFSDTAIWILEDKNALEESEYEEVPFRKVKWQQMIGKRPYWLEVKQPLLETGDAASAIVLGMAPVVLLLILVMVLILSWVSNRLWKPFEESLAIISDFTPQQNAALHFPQTDTIEFARLNSQLQSMTDKVMRDYQNLKSFTDNASHEMQTPLAIVQLHLDALIQSPHLMESDMAHIAASLAAVQRLRRLHEGLLTLSKIENGIFNVPKPIDLAELLKQQIHAVQELAELQSIAISFEATVTPTLYAHPLLCELIFSNLINNAIRHNMPHGRILIVLSQHSLSIANTATANALDEIRLFQRFQKQNHNSQGLGLGLSIIKECCDRAQWKIEYHFAEGMHRFEIHF